MNKKDLAELLINKIIEISLSSFLLKNLQYADQYRDDMKQIDCYEKYLEQKKAELLDLVGE